MFPSPIIFNRNINPNLHTEYERWDAYLTAQLASGAWNNALSNPTIATGSLVMNRWTAYTAGTVTGTMLGSSWSTNQTNTSASVSRAVQHMYQTLAAYQQSFNRFDKLIVFRNGTTSTSRFQSVNRNGYTSGGNTSGGNCAGFNSMIYYDPTLYRVRRYDGNRAVPVYSDFIF